jgi:hypothetical protein
MADDDNVVALHTMVAGQGLAITVWGCQPL